MKFFKKDFKQKNLIVLDIGSQFIKALLLKVDKKEGRGILLGWAKENFSDEFEKLCLNCRKAIKKVEKKTGLKAEEVFIGIGGDILRGTSAAFCYKRENPKEKIDLTELKYFVQKTQWKAFEKIRKEFGLETGLPETDARLVSAHIINIKVDNTHLANPLSFQGENVCLSIFNSYTSLKWLEELVKLASYLELELVGINSPSYALFHSFELEHSSKEDILVIDIGGKITEVTLIKRGGEMVETRNFNLGGYLFTKTIADFLGLKPEEAEVIKIKYSKEEISPEARKKLERLFSPNFSFWVGGVKVVLDEFSKRYKALPTKIFLCGGGSALPGIKEALKRKGSFKINLISLREITKIRNKTKFNEIPSLALAALALESAEASEFSSILKRAVRLIQG
ncbi:MAG: pilus assembly protein PilM [Patescibacteria group bacterium]